LAKRQQAQLRAAADPVNQEIHKRQAMETELEIKQVRNNLAGLGVGRPYVEPKPRGDDITLH